MRRNGSDFFYGKSSKIIKISYNFEHEGAETVDFDDFFEERITKEEFDAYYEKLPEGSR